MRIVRLFSLLALPLIAHAQESPSPTAASSPSRTVALRFAQPPMAGTISLGVYDAKGKLVRILHREDAISDFTVGHDALETSWDGKNDAGDSLPPGKYSARGYLVANLKIEGVDYFFNDWVTDEKSPRVVALFQLRMSDGELYLTAEVAGNKTIDLVCDQMTGAIQRESPSPAATSHCADPPKLANLISPVDCAAGRDGTTWFIDSPEENGPREVKQLSPAHEVLRHLVYPKDDPQPQSIEASAKAERIFLVDKGDHLQRLKALSLVRTISKTPEGSISDWKTDFEKKIVAHKNFSIANGKPEAAAPNEHVAPEKIGKKLQPNPLQHDQAGEVELAVGIDPDGSYLETADGLPLRTISETPNLSRAVMTAHGENAIDIFEDDGAVVEQFRVSGLDQMMAFDCGSFELK